MPIVRHIGDFLTTRLRAYETRRALQRLSDRSLADLGLERDLVADVAAMAAQHGDQAVSLAQISAMAAQALSARHVPQPVSPSPLASLLGTPKSARLATAD